MTKRLYEYLCVCNEKLQTEVSLIDLKRGERCDTCSRVYDVAYSGAVTPMPLPPSAKVTQNDRTIHTVYRSIHVDADRSNLKPSITATLIKEYS